MPIQLKRVAPMDFREAIVDFLWRIRTWPYPTKDEYFRYWDWRNSSLSELEPVVWVALEGDAVVGHVAVNFRNLQVGGHAVRVGVPANFRVEDRYRTIVGALLTRSIQSLVRSQQADMLLGYSNAKAHAIARAVGFREIGLMRSFVEVRKWGPVLARRVPGGAALAPIARVITAIQRSMRAGGRAGFSARLAARELSVADLSSANKLHWLPSKSLVWNGKLSFLSKRFLECPARTYRVIGIFDESNDRLEGYVVTEGNDRMNIVQCDVNESVLSEVEAVQLAVAATPDAEVVIVALLPQSDLAHQFSAAGFALRSIGSSDEVLRETTWSAYSRPGHARARDFADASNWKLWYGWNNH